MSFLIYFILICIALFFVKRFLNRFKFFKIGSVALYDGAIKSGKSGVSFAHARVTYKKILRRWKICCFIIGFLNFFLSKSKKLKNPEKPLFYSNIPVACEYVPLTDEFLVRKVRFNYKSVVFIDEATLVADSSLYKDVKLNFQLLQFCKLFGHETHGGKLFLNTHQVGDLHISFRRVISQHFYIHHTFSSPLIPFFAFAKVREERYSEDKTVLNNYSEDVENSLKTIIFRKKYLKEYDPFCYSCLTDNLESPQETKKFNVSDRKKGKLKTNYVTSFRGEFQKENLKYEKKDD